MVRPALRLLALLSPLSAGAACYAPMVMSEDDSAQVLARQLVRGPSPADAGEYPVRTLTYGSGTDRNRVEFRDSVAFRTDSVDASPFVSLGGSASSRNGYWGFSPKGFPLNGRVWYPEGDGPFPLVLVVHGNHNPQDFSDPGYDYLGELLASRGYILVSVDMNFINGGIRVENDGRGWLLLKHLEAWHGFASEPGNPFHDRVDLDRISLMGHSRGGEAVAHAAAFNRLQRYPDDANVTFDFGYAIRSIVAIAPVDGQYLPTDRKVPVQGVDYLVFHGSHDGDVTSFHGLRQWNRITWPEGGDHFKAAVYMYRANHGQWNTVWNNLDNGPRSARRLDLRYLVPREDQRRFGELYISAFLDLTLRGEDRWRPIFRDHRVIGGWMPKTMYVTQLQHASFEPLATFDEDIDVTTGARDGVRIRGEGLDSWSEETLRLRSRNRTSTSASQENQAVRIGWAPADDDEEDGEDGGEDTEMSSESPGAEEDAPVVPRWSIELTSAVAPEATPTTSLDLQLVWVDRPEEDSIPLDLTVELVDAEGGRSRVALSSYGAIREPLEIRILRRQDIESGVEHSEPVLQSFHLPLADFSGVNPSRIREVHLVFDRHPEGEVLVDGIGFSDLGSDAWSVRVPPGGLPD